MAGEGYVVVGAASATEAGSYAVTLTLEEGCRRADGTTEPKTLFWSIVKAKTR